jgi:hypothetical protein
MLVRQPGRSLVEQVAHRLVTVYIVHGVLTVHTVDTRSAQRRYRCSTTAKGR